MVDNTELNAGTGGNTIATDDIAGIHHQRVKVEFGEDGAAIDVSAVNPLPVEVANGPPGPGTYDTFGHLVTGQLNNQVDVQFFRDTPQNLVTVSTTGSGAAVQNVGGALFSSGVDTTASSKGVSQTNVIYRSGAEVYAIFTAAFTAGIASSFQRIGLYDTNDGFFLSFEGTSFGVTTRNNAVDVTIAKASFSDDDLTGAASSLFTRDGTPEAIDLTKLNVYRIRFGWLGSAPTCFEVMAPDGHWVIFHRTLYPNLQVNPSIRNADLPVTLDISKTAAGATDLQMQTDCWGAGVTTNHQRLDDVLTDASLADTIRAVISAFNGTSFVNIQATTAGNLKMSVQEVSDGLDVGAGNAGAETQRVSIATDDVNLAAINAGQLPDGHAVTVDNAVGSPANVQISDGVDTVLVSAGGALMVDGSAVTQPVSAASLPLPAGAATLAAQLPDGHNVTVDNASLVVDGSAVTQPISAASLPLPAGAATSAGQLADGHNVAAAGDVAHDAPDTGNPVKIGAVAETTEQTAVADGDRANLMTDLNGKLVTQPYAVPERSVDGVTAAITGTGDTAVIAAPGAGLRLYITELSITNSHATVGTLVEIKSATTVRKRMYAREDGGGSTHVFPKPLRMGDNEALNAANTTTGSNTYVSASGFIAP